MSSDEDMVASRGVATKSVSIVESPGSSPRSSPRIHAKMSPYDFLYGKPHPFSRPRRLSASASTSQSLVAAGGHGSASTHGESVSENEDSKPKESYPRHPSRMNHHRHHHSNIVAQVTDWLKHEKAKKDLRSSRKLKAAPKIEGGTGTAGITQGRDEMNPSLYVGDHAQSPSEISDEGVDLDRLEQILSGLEMSLSPKTEKKDTYFPYHQLSSARSYRKGSSGALDREVLDDDDLVPSTEVILDNTKTFTYSSSAAASSISLRETSRRAVKEREAWLQFKNEIVRLAHTLKLKGWRRVPLDRGGEIDVQRLSGALTNAVYVVSPPNKLPQSTTSSHSATAPSVPRKLAPPPKLLLRIYGSQSDHLIDREGELQILKRLRRKNLGPRLLGTFTNGRFEQFFYARTLTAQDLRIPQTSRQIAMRMRELHDGIELLEKERDDGPFVWQTWDKWVKRCEEVITWLDQRLSSGKEVRPKSVSEVWESGGLICGVKWATFKQMVHEYRERVKEHYGGAGGISQRLIFAHNDTQYGNVLRLEPSGTSPLLQPANEHKQLIVIDFEYASANVPALEFANHFTEWCYNYHDPSKPYALNERLYPTPEEQHRFLKAYLQHRSPASPQAQNASDRPSTSPASSSFALDNGAASAEIAEQEQARERKIEEEIQHLMQEIRLWRIANSAQWVAWGIVQAKIEIEEMDNNDDLLEETQESENAGGGDNAAQGGKDEQKDKEAEAEEQGDEEDEFDYLAYAQERAYFFWGDVLQLGLVKKEDLPAELLAKVKIVRY